MEVTNLVSSINGVIYTLIDVIRGIANPVGVFALVIIGIIWVASENDNTITKCKAWMVRIAIGMAIINLAEVIMSVFSKIGA